MAYLIDTNIFIRLAKRNDPDRQQALDAIRRLRAKKEDLCYTTQVLVEFWNVSTRPVTARGGLGHSLQVTERKAQLIEKNFRLLTESIATHQEWRRLVTAHSVEGVEVHDTMLVAVMTVHGISHLSWHQQRLDFAHNHALPIGSLLYGSHKIGVVPQHYRLASSYDRADEERSPLPHILYTFFRPAHKLPVANNLYRFPDQSS